MGRIRNISNQAVVINRKGGAVLQLLPGKAFVLSDEEVNVQQVQTLLQGGFLKKEEAAAEPAKKPEPAGDVKPHKREEDKKKG